MAAGKRTTASVPWRQLFVDGGSHAAGHTKSVTLDGTTVDAGASPTTALRRGLVVGKAQSGGKYLHATAATVQGALPAEHIGDTSPTFAGTESMTYTIEGGPILTVGPTAAGDDTLAEVITFLNANPAFSSYLEAFDSSSKLAIRSTEVGSDAHFEILTAPAGWKLTAGAYVGSAGDFGVLQNPEDMLDPLGVASDQVGVTIVQRGRFKASSLVGLTADAREFFNNRGATFE